MSEKTQPRFIATAKGPVPFGVLNKGKDYLKSMERNLHSMKVRKKARYLSPSAQQHMDNGKEAFEIEDFDTAIMEFFEVVIEDPDNAEAYKFLGNCYYKKGDYKQAMLEYLQSLVADDEYADAYNNLGNVYAELGMKVPPHREEFQKLAIKSLSRAVELDDTNPIFYVNYGMALQESGRLEEAEKCFRKALALDSKNVDAVINLGNVYRIKGQFQEAIAAYEDALVRDPGNVVARKNLVATFLKLGRYDEAEQQIHWILEANPFDAEAKRTLRCMDFLKTYDR